jgi:hypothetical protein
LAIPRTRSSGGRPLTDLIHDRITVSPETEDYEPKM